MAGRSAARLSGMELSTAALERYAGRAVLVGIRPEMFSVARQDTADALVVDIDVIEPTGPDTLAVFQLGDRTLAVFIEAWSRR